MKDFEYEKQYKRYKYLVFYYNVDFVYNTEINVEYNNYQKNISYPK